VSRQLCACQLTMQSLLLQLTIAVPQHLLLGLARRQETTCRQSQQPTTAHSHTQLGKLGAISVLNWVVLLKNEHPLS
jgi:hypothetical protein